MPATLKNKDEKPCNSSFRVTNTVFSWKKKPLFLLQESTFCRALLNIFTNTYVSLQVLYFSNCKNCKKKSAIIGDVWEAICYTVNIKLYKCAKLLVCTSEVKRKRHASHAASSVVMAEQKMKAETTLVSSAKWSQLLYKIAFSCFHWFHKIFFETLVAHIQEWKLRAISLICNDWRIPVQLTLKQGHEKLVTSLNAQWFLMTVLLLSDDHLMTGWWLLNNRLMTIQRPCLLSALSMPDDCLMIAL